MRVGRSRVSGHSVTVMPRTGPLVIAYDASPASKLAIDEAGSLFPGQRALVVHVWEAGAAYADVTDATELPVIDTRTAPDLDAAMYDAARLTAQEGAEHARRVNIDAEALVVADEATVPETLLRVACRSATLAPSWSARTATARFVSGCSAAPPSRSSRMPPAQWSSCETERTNRRLQLDRVLTRHIGEGPVAVRDMGRQDARRLVTRADEHAVDEVRSPDRAGSDHRHAGRLSV